jgi:hypothetical protein
VVVYVVPVSKLESSPVAHIVDSNYNIKSIFMSSQSCGVDVSGEQGQDDKQDQHKDNNYDGHVVRELFRNVRLERNFFFLLGLVC